MRPGLAGSTSFQSAPVQVEHVSGEPRDLEIADLDHDGWNDVIVVLRDADTVQAWRNVNGRPTLSSSITVGRSPREIAQADFNNDGTADFVVANRHSYDVSVLIGVSSPVPGFRAVDQVYPTDGEVSSVALANLNGDAKLDVVQIHRATSEVSTRLSTGLGKLGPPVLYTVNLRPTLMEVADVTGDGRPDIITANLSDGHIPGNVSFRASSATGVLGPEIILVRPGAIAATDHGSFTAVKAADFDGDGKMDIAAAYEGRSLFFYRGTGGGAFVLAPNSITGAGVPFTYQTVRMVTGDFDGDGDIDLAGAGFYGEVSVLRNDGAVFSSAAPVVLPVVGPGTTPGHYRAKTLESRDLNTDGRLDLLIALDEGVSVWLGQTGGTFVRWTNIPRAGGGTGDVLPFIGSPVGGLVFGDFDHSGTEDIAATCLRDGCLTILARGAGGEFSEGLRVSVPSAEHLAAGDVDGDGLRDLVGSGRSQLWVAPSGQPAQQSVSQNSVIARTPIGHVVINELMADNRDVFTNLPPDIVDDGTFPDWIELSSPVFTSLGGWKLELVPASGAPISYTFPAGTSLVPGGHLTLVAAAPATRSPWHTGFELPAAGATLRLKDNAGTVIDTVAYPEQSPDKSFARYADGLSVFSYNRMPDPGAANIYNGPAPPHGAFAGVGVTPPAPGQPITFAAAMVDDAAVLGASIVWWRTDALPGATTERHRVLLYDDGAHSDGAARDTSFAGTLPGGLPAGAEIRFYLEATDASGLTLYLPEAPGGDDDDIARLFSLSITNVQPALEISELVSVNDGAWRDPEGGTPDYVEVRNTSAAAVPLENLTLKRDLFDDDEAFAFPPGFTLAPGAHVIIACDSDPEQGPMHAPFGLSGAGGRVFLAGATASGATSLIDAVSYPSLKGNQSLFRLGAGGEWFIGSATPGGPNSGPDGFIFLRGAEVVYVYPSASGRTTTVQSSSNLQNWTPAVIHPGDGMEHLHVETGAGRRFLRTKNE